MIDRGTEMASREWECTYNLLLTGEILRRLKDPFRFCAFGSSPPGVVGSAAEPSSAWWSPNSSFCNSYVPTTRRLPHLGPDFGMNSMQLGGLSRMNSDNCLMDVFCVAAADPSSPEAISNVGDQYRVFSNEQTISCDNL